LIIGKVEGKIRSNIDTLSGCDEAFEPSEKYGSFS
jgi:hypothetical protein